MKRKPLALAAFSLSIVAGSALAAEPSIKIYHENEDSYPWIFKDRVGLTTSLLKMAEKIYGGKVEVVGLPWKRCLDDVKSGAINGVVKISYAADRTEFLAYPMTGDKPDATLRPMARWSVSARSWWETPTLWRSPNSSMARKKPQPGSCGMPLPRHVNQPSTKTS